MPVNRSDEIWRGKGAQLAGAKARHPIANLIVTPDQVRDEIKALIDTCAPGGGYMFETSCGLDYAKRENVEVMFDTVRNYGKA